MTQGHWLKHFASYPYAQSLLEDWRRVDHSQDSHWNEYQQALETYLRSQDEATSLGVRHRCLLKSKEEFETLVAKGDAHIGTSLALIRVHQELEDHQAAKTVINRMLLLMPWLNEPLPATLRLRINRPFLAPSREFEERPIIPDNLGHWLQDVVHEVLHPSAPPADLETHRNTQVPEPSAYSPTPLASQEHDQSRDSTQPPIGLDRDNVPAYLDHARMVAETDPVSAWITLREAQRIAPLPESKQRRLAELQVDFSNPDIKQYLERIGAIRIKRSIHPRKILVVTNLFPPQEMGGFGRTMWEFCHVLLQRDHDLSILTADMPHLYRAPSDDSPDIEAHVKRDLQLYGDWRNGKTVTDTDTALIKQKILHNCHRILAEVSQFRPSACLIGNLDFLAYQFLEPILQQKIPIVHRLGNSIPGYPSQDTPRSPLYCLAGASEWLNSNLQAQGYVLPNQAVVHPASTLETYYRHYPPVFDSLRICFAGLLMPYKGAHILLQALAILKQQGIPFTCELAGDTTDPAFPTGLLQTARAGGFSENIRFPGFLDRKSLSALYSRSNVMVFPSLVHEAFGKSQIEAMAAGLAVITSATGGAREIITHGINGLIFESGNAHDLAEKLALVYNNKDDALSIATRGQEDAFKYTTANSVKKIESLFDLLTAKSTDLGQTFPDALIRVTIQTMPKSGTHYVINSLQRHCPELGYATVFDNEIPAQDASRRKNVIVTTRPCRGYVLKSHFFAHGATRDLLATDHFTVYLISFFFDSLYSWSADLNKKDKKYSEYKLRTESKEWHYISDRLDSLSTWLGMLDSNYILRYEDANTIRPGALHQDLERLGSGLVPYLQEKHLPDHRRLYYAHGSAFYDALDARFDPEIVRHAFLKLEKFFYRHYPEKANLIKAYIQEKMSFHY